MRTVTVYQTDEVPVGWAVEMIDPDDDGACEKALFYGGDSKRRAHEFALRHYVHVNTVIVLDGRLPSASPR